MSEDHQSREYPQAPIIGVGGVIFRGNKVLLVRRAKPPRQGAWSLPGGAQEPDEEAEATFSREIFEETGLEIEPQGFVETVEFIERDQDGAVKYHYTLLDYWAESTQGEARPGDDVSEIAWAPLEGLGPYDLWDKTVDVISTAADMRAKQRHSIKGHLRTTAIAVAFGMTAYGFIHLLIWLLKTLGLLDGG